MMNTSNLIFFGGLAIGGFIAVLAIGAILLIRSREGKDISKQEMKNPGPVALFFKWIAMLSLIATISSLVALFTIQSISFAWISVGSMLLFLIAGPIYRVLLLAGK